MAISEKDDRTTRVTLFVFIHTVIFLEGKNVQNTQTKKIFYAISWLPYNNYILSDISTSHWSEKFPRNDEILQDLKTEKKIFFNKK